MLFPVVFGIEHIRAVCEKHVYPQQAICMIPHTRPLTASQCRGEVRDGGGGVDGDGDSDSGVAVDNTLSILYLVPVSLLHGDMGIKLLGCHRTLLGCLLLCCYYTAVLCTKHHYNPTRNMPI